MEKKKVAREEPTKSERRVKGEKTQEYKNRSAKPPLLGGQLTKAGKNQTREQEKGRN